MRVVKITVLRERKNIKLERMHTPKCGNILKKFNSKNGEYYLHSNVSNDVKDPYIRYLKLYKKEKTDGHDTFRLIAQKLEVKKEPCTEIRRNVFNKHGELIEVSKIEPELFGIKVFSYIGEALQMTRPILITGKKHIYTKELKIELDLEKKLTPMARRILGLIKNYR